MFRIAFVLTLLCSIPAAAQNPFVAIPPERAADYRIDFTNFYPDSAAERQDRVRTYAMLEQLKGLEGRVTASPTALLEALRLREAVTARFNRHIIYLQLHFATDMRDAASRQESAKLQSDVDAGTAFVRTELVSLTDDTLAAYSARVPELRPYAGVIERSRRYRPYTRPAGEEQILARAANLTSDLPAQLWQQALTRANPGTIEADGRQVSVGAALSHASAAVREAAWKKRYAAIDAQRDLFAIALIGLANSRNELSRTRGFDGNPAEAHFNLYLDTRDVLELYDGVLSYADLYRRYQRVTAEHTRRTAGLDSLRAWDQGLADPNVKGTRFTIDEATTAITAALAPFGEDMRRELAHLLDPRNGRLDIVPGPARAPGAFAWGVPGLMTTFFYHSGYQGTYRDFTTLAHEASHAVHGQLLGENKALITADMGPPYFAEGFAMFFELVLNDWLVANETDAARRAYFHEQFLWRTMLTFNVTRQAIVEQAIYDGVRDGTISSANDLDSATVRVGRRLSIWYDTNPELKNEWNMVQHYYNAPMYVPNYAYASILGLKLYQQYRADPSGFAPRFMALLQGGFPEAPARLLERHMNIDLNDPRTLADAMAVMAERLGQLEAAYAGM